LAKTGALDRKTGDRKKPRGAAASPAKFRKVAASSSRAGSGVTKPEKERNACTKTLKK
jgi:hypothetical protein